MFGYNSIHLANNRLFIADIQGPTFGVKAILYQNGRSRFRRLAPKVADYHVGTMLCQGATHSTAQQTRAARHPGYLAGKIKSHGGILVHCHNYSLSVVLAEIVGL